jgi:hypothetical protein
MRLDPEENIIAAALDEAELDAASRRIPTHTTARSTYTGFRGILAFLALWAGIIGAFYSLAYYSVR